MAAVRPSHGKSEEHAAAATATTTPTATTTVPATATTATTVTVARALRRGAFLSLWRLKADQPSLAQP